MSARSARTLPAGNPNGWRGATLTGCEASREENSGLLPEESMGVLTVGFSQYSGRVLFNIHAITPFCFISAVRDISRKPMTELPR